jgi:hypothetical protein
MIREKFCFFQKDSQGDMAIGTMDCFKIVLRPFRPYGMWRQGSTDFWIRGGRGFTHRCYCLDGFGFDVRLSIGGWGFILFTTLYWGDVPCSCDLAIQELESQGANE